MLLTIHKYLCTLKKYQKVHIISPIFQVNDPDIVIMADVDTFPMKQSILEPIERNPDKSVWVFQYDDSAKHDSTFSMSFTAMRSQTWKQLLQNSQSTTELIEKFDEKLQLKKR